MPFVRNNFLVGNHSAALEQKYHDEIAQFLLWGEPWNDAPDLTTWTRRIGRGALRLFLFVPMLVLWGVFYYIPDGVNWLQHYLPALALLPEPWPSMVLAVLFVLLLVLVLLLAQAPKSRNR